MTDPTLLLGGRATYDIGIDADGVLHSFGDSFKHYLISENIRTERDCASSITEYAFYRRWGITDKEFSQICHDGVNAGIIFMHGSPFRGTPEGMRRLREAGHRLHIITDRFFGAPGASEDLTKRWLARYGIPYDTLTFSADKTCKWTDIMIDDKPENYDSLEAAGTVAVLHNRPWNHDDDDGRRRVYSFTHFVNLVESGAYDNQIRLVPNRPAQYLPVAGR